MLLNDRGELAEGASTNVFVVQGRHGSARRPSARASSPGITREVLLELCRDLAPAASARSRSTLDDLAGADEAFLTSTTREAVPIRTVDGRPVGDGPARARHPQDHGSLPGLRGPGHRG